MSEAAPENTATETPVDVAPEATDQQASESNLDSLPSWAREAISKANGEAAKYRTRVRELEPKASQLDQLEEASKSEAQRKDEAAAVAQRERDDAKAEAARYKIALRHGIAEEDFDLLGSGSEEQIEARAQKVAAKNEAAKQAALDAAVQTPTSPEPRRPTPNLRPGASPSPDPVQDDSYYPSDWLSPTQRAHVEKARNNS